MSPKKTRRRRDRESTKSSPRKKRTVYAPQPDHMTTPPTVISVELGEDEKVEWHWTHFADGRSCVTGYTINELPRSKLRGIKRYS